jgi:hypothetical protein
MGRKAPRKSLLLAAKKSVGGDVKVIQDVTQVLFAAVQIGLNSIGNPGSKVSGLGPAHVFFEDVGLYPAVDPVVIYVAGRTGGCAHLNRWIMGGLELHFCFCLPYAFLFTRCLARLLSRTTRAGKSEHQRQHQRCEPCNLNHSASRHGGDEPTVDQQGDAGYVRGSGGEQEGCCPS